MGDETGREADRKFNDPELAHSAPPVVHECAPMGKRITLYDRQHFLTYARLQDAEAAGLDWRTGTQRILRRDVAADPDGAWQCWTTHLARAHWIATTGYALALVKAGLISRP